MKLFGRELRWNKSKSKDLRKARGMSFEEIVKFRMVRIEEHPMTGRPLLLYEIKNYIWVVPCVFKEKEVFLKTLYPSRKYTKLIKRGGLK